MRGSRIVISVTWPGPSYCSLYVRLWAKVWISQIKHNSLVSTVKTLPKLLLKSCNTYMYIPVPVPVLSESCWSHAIYGFNNYTAHSQVDDCWQQMVCWNHDQLQTSGIKVNAESHVHWKAWPYLSWPSFLPSHLLWLKAKKRSGYVSEVYYELQAVAWAYLAISPTHHTGEVIALCNRVDFAVNKV